MNVFVDGMESHNEENVGAVNWTLIGGHYRIASATALRTFDGGRFIVFVVSRHCFMDWLLLSSILCLRLRKHHYHFCHRSRPQSTSVWISFETDLPQQFDHRRTSKQHD
jgi:hypothetical protein